ncbi:hypothetical protein [[Eubacterium] cellulosolvens]
MREADVMFTKIRIIMDEKVYVPNSQVSASEIVNCSALPKVIVCQHITISYDAPR